ncbi:MAG TPA: M20/M25/M40 family metallo-hydrolase [Baekduia sp.]
MDETLEARAVAALDPDALAADTAALVREPSVTGDERGALERLAALADARGLPATLLAHDLDALRAAPGHPGEEAPRDELLTLTAVLPGRAGAPRLCLNGHVDVVGPGAEPWSRDPFGGAIADGWVHGRGAVDMKGAVIAALHAMAAVREAGDTGGGAGAEVVLQAVPSEEDGGLGTFAALRADARFDACLIPEPTGFDVVLAHGGALTCTGTVRGTAAHAAFRLEGVSAIDRYVSLHQAMAEHEHAINADVLHPLMRALPLPYPVLVGRIAAGEWSSSVPDELRFEARVGVRVGETVEEARAAFAAALAAADDGAGPPAEIAWSGGQFEPCETPADDPFVALVRDAATPELGGTPPRLAGVPYGADMRLFRRHGIPTVMFGTGGFALAHAVDERVAIADLLTLARTLTRVIVRFGATA